MKIVFEKLKDPRIAALLGLLVGLFWAWMVQPVQFVDATPSYLRPDLQEDYLRMTIDSFTLNGDVSLALRRWDDLGPTAYQHLQTIEQNPALQDPMGVMAFSQLIQAQRPAASASAAAETGKGMSTPMKWGLILLVLMVVAAAAYYAFRLFRKGGGELTAAKEANLRSKEVEVIDFESAGYEPPMAQFVTTYVVGDDLYDDSFSVEAPNGDFLGECGMGISDTIGVGTESKRVSAFEIWLFDKNDIQTVTKVLMTPHLFKDPNAVQRLSEKGEPIMAEPRKQVMLETATLKIIATLSDMALGKDGTLPDESYFEHLTVQLAVWTKEAPEPQIL